MFDIPHISTFIDEYSRNSSLVEYRHKVKELIYKKLDLQTLPPIGHNEYGRPFLEDYPSINISISHTYGAVSFIASLEHYVGIDIELLSNRVVRVAHKIINNKEKEIINISDPKDIHIVFSAKETAFKLMCNPNSNINSFNVSDIDRVNGRVLLSCQRLVAHNILKNNTIKCSDKQDLFYFNIKYKLTDKYVLCYAII